MPQMSSIDRILMAGQYMTDALKHPHHDVPFTTIGDDTITALEFFPRNLHKEVQKAGKNGPYPGTGEVTWYTTKRRAKRQHTFSPNSKSYS
jgi:hypothetical protein